MLHQSTFAFFFFASLWCIFLKQLAKYDSEHSLVDSVSVYINCRRTVLAQCLYEPIPHPSSALPPKWLFISVWTKKLFPLQKQLLKQKEKRKHSTRWCLPHIFFSVECSQSRTANLSPGFVREAQKKVVLHNMCSENQNRNHSKLTHSAKNVQYQFGTSSYFILFKLSESESVWITTLMLTL